MRNFLKASGIFFIMFGAAAVVVAAYFVPAVPRAVIAAGVVSVGVGIASRKYL